MKYTIKILKSYGHLACRIASANIVNNYVDDDDDDDDQDDNNDDDDIRRAQ